MNINIHYFLKFTFFIRYTFITICAFTRNKGGGGGGGGDVARKPDLVACEQHRHRPGCAFMQSDPHRCVAFGRFFRPIVVFDLQSRAPVYNIQIGFIKNCRKAQPKLPIRAI